MATDAAISPANGSSRPVAKSRRLKVGGIAVEVVRKRIKHLHLGVYPPEGRVRT